MEGWVALGQLVGETAEGPDVNLLIVGRSLCDLWGDPRGCAALCVPIRFLLSQKDTEAKICELDLAVGPTEDVVRLDVAVKNIVLVHLFQAQCHRI